MTPSVASSFSVRQGSAGSALMLVLVLLVISFAAGFYWILDPQARHLEDQDATARGMARAVEALMAYAVTGPTPGRLPCPDMDLPPDGFGDQECATQGGSSLGRLPWRTLGLPPLRDEGRALLIYALAEGWKPAGGGGRGEGLKMVGQRDLDAAAMVIAPGAPLAGQVRNMATVGRDGAFSGWLEGDAQGGTFEQRPLSERFNDRLLPVDAQKLSMWIRREDAP